MANDIYTEFGHAFKAVGASAILHNGKHVANVSFKHTNLRTVCYIHILGTRMARGVATGHGYCKTDAAFWSAAHALEASDIVEYKGVRHHFIGYPDQGSHWETHLRNTGFTVINVI